MKCRDMMLSSSFFKWVLEVHLALPPHCFTVDCLQQQFAVLGNHPLLASGKCYSLRKLLVLDCHRIGFGQGDYPAPQTPAVQSNL